MTVCPYCDGLRVEGYENTPAENIAILKAHLVKCHPEHGQAVGANASPEVDAQPRGPHKNVAVASFTFEVPDPPDDDGTSVRSGRE